ncbi:hypothetical+protein [Methylocapsa aurea]|uniref:DUF1403 family protein n=1 Tax=Methylocapsa aurea TaxID=663610 RepID=UPI003D18C443
MRRFDPADPLAATAPATPPVRRRTVRVDATPPSSTLILNVYPAWARLPTLAGAVFSAGAGLALFDQIVRAEPPFAGALRRRLALRAAAAAATALRLREDEAALRDAEHLAFAGGETSPAGRLHRLWRAFADRPATLDAAAFCAAAESVDLPRGSDWATLAAEARAAAAGCAQPLAAAAAAGAVLSRRLPATACAEAELLAWWAADVALAEHLAWERPVALVATTMLRPALRVGSNGRRLRPSDPQWPDAVAGAVALATSEALALAAELARRADRLLAVAPKLRAKGAGRVVELLLADDAVSPARAARMARLSDRAARRLFDRLVALGAVRELSGRPNFRLYGL